MTKYILILQLCFFISFGLWAGDQFNKAQQKARIDGYVQALLQTPFKEILNMPIPKEI